MNLEEIVALLGLLAELQRERRDLRAQLTALRAELTALNLRNAAMEEEQVGADKIEQSPTEGLPVT